MPNLTSLISTMLKESDVNKRGIQFPRLGRKRSSLADMHTYVSWRQVFFKIESEDLFNIQLKSDDLKIEI